MLKGTIPMGTVSEERNATRGFFKRVALIFTVLLLFTSISVFFFVYKPLHTQLRASITNNFIQNSVMRYQSFDYMMELSEQSAKSIASRPVLNETMFNYLEGQLNLDEVVSFIQPKYNEIMDPIDYLVKAERIMDDVVVATVDTGLSQGFSCAIGQDLIYSDNLQKVFCLEADHTHYELMSPIFYYDDIVGYDHLLFCLSKQIEIFAGENLSSQVISTSDYDSLLAGADNIVAKDSHILAFRADGYYHFTPVADDFYFVTRQDREDLLEAIHELSLQNVTAGTAIILVNLFIMYYFIGKYARDRITIYQRSHDTLSRKLAESSLDPMTQLPLRRYGEDQLAESFAEYTETGVSPAILMFDIDYLKEINDSYGHAVGDDVIAAVAQAVAESVRKEDLLYRWGGDEFIGIIIGLKRLHLDFFKNKLVVAVDKVAIEANGNMIRPTVSIGISYFEKSDYSYHDAVRRADEAMYQLKFQKKV